MKRLIFKKISSIIVVFFLINLIIAINSNADEFKKKTLKKNKNSSQKSIVEPEEAGVQNGDLVFQSLGGSQGNALKYALNSKINHVGMVYIVDDEVFVLEAMAKVRLTPWKKCVKRNKGKFTIKRMKNSERFFTKDKWKKIEKYVDSAVGKEYDFAFCWDDERFYCSELIWKLYNECLNQKLGNLKKIKDCNLEHPLVKKMLKERYGDNIPLEETVASPSEMYKSKQLETIFKN
ncbi:MAG TPA: YiiX/YebB-like N1pC/P60 family cysteine hydrolase [bacterium]|nr:YiiX/YebB-like N1pC/P60 family cysteine hydrolase [bacterium]HPN31388.1 YiiX/YebB-like N1pC/P60 family cysteine hydrolase [bacterium]